MNDPRDKARREAIAFGTPDDLAAYLAKHASVHNMPRVTNVKATSTRPATPDRLRLVCEMYRAESLIPEFRQSGASLAAVAQMLDAATGKAKAIGPAGVGYVRMRLSQSGVRS